MKRAAALRRIDRGRLELARHPTAAVLTHVKEMEALHAAAALFRSHPPYAAPEKVKQLLAADSLRILDDGTG